LPANRQTVVRLTSAPFSSSAMVLSDREASLIVAKVAVGEREGGGRVVMSAATMVTWLTVMDEADPATVTHGLTPTAQRRMVEVVVEVQSV